MSTATMNESRGRALVVDDTRFNRQLLGSLLLKEGYEVFEAENGNDAIDKLASFQPDIIFMDVVMPVMDGYETTRQIKSKYQDDFIPVIFITGLNDDESLVRCIDAGGDDFISKPFRESVLKAKVQAMERIRDLYRERKYLLAYMQRDQDIAEEVFRTAVVNDELALQSLYQLVKPATTFSGDILLTSYGPTGDLHVILGDFTGHGLAAAIGALPLSDVFQAMTKKGFGVSDIIVSINAKLCHALPDGMFMACCYLCLKADGKSIEIWNGGMNDISIIDQNTMSIRETFASNAFPMGITPTLDGLEKTIRVMVKPQDAVFMYSDGVVEEENTEGVPFGVDRLHKCISQTPELAAVIENVTAELAQFCTGRLQADDISLVAVPVHAYKLQRQHVDSGIAEIMMRGQWQWSLVLKGAQLGRIEPVPLAISQVNELVKIPNHGEVLFTILTELYNNALDHGVLGLDSALKNSESGFLEYYTLRESRLADIQEGMVRLDLKLENGVKGLGIRIRVQDSGKGFAYNRVSVEMDKNNFCSGRGIALVRELTEDLTYSGDGNVVDALYLLS